VTIRHPSLPSISPHLNHQKTIRNTPKTQKPSTKAPFQPPPPQKINALKMNLTDNPLATPRRADATYNQKVASSCSSLSAWAQQPTSKVLLTHAAPLPNIAGVAADIPLQGK
jgi:hypothetical protein